MHTGGIPSVASFAHTMTTTFSDLRHSCQLLATTTCLGLSVACSLMAPAQASPAAPVVSREAALPANPQTIVKTGRFVSGEHPTKGMVLIVRENQQLFVQLGADFKTSDSGPDLVVILHRAADVLASTRPPSYPLAEGSFVVVAELKAFQGAQRYALPATIRLADYPSAAIWCRRFNATFGAARLQ